VNRRSSLQAVVLTGRERLELREIAEPVPTDGDVVVRVRAVGICGTDLKIFRGEIPVAYPRVLGHEMVGETLGTSDGVRHAGSRVIVDPSVSCGRCGRCLEGRPNLCAAGSLLGRDRDGGLCELVAVPAANLHPLPDAIDDVSAPFVQVLTTCVHGQRLTEIVPGDRVIVVGLGVTGLLHVQLARQRGAGLVVGVTRNRAKLRLAETLGADVTVPADERSAADRVMEATSGGGDVVIEAVGTVATLALAVRMARPGGRVLAYGTISETAGAFPFYELYFKELVVSAPRAATPTDFPVAIDAIASGRVRVDPLISRRADLRNAGEAVGALTTEDLKTIVRV
jgi:L-iditol 2-dehydrogenase